MKILLLNLILTILTVPDIYSQKIPSEIGDIKVEITSFSFKRNKDFELTKRVVKNGRSKYFFDNKGLLIEEVYYGKHHDNNATLLDKVEQHYYSKTGQLIHSKQWDTDYDKNIHQTYHTDYKYDSTNRLVEEVTYDDKDSIFFIIKKEYTESKTITILKSILYKSPETVIREFDNDQKIVSKKQLWDNDTKMNWIIKYSYEDNCIIEDFDSYYDDSIRDYSKKKTECYDKDKLVEIEDYYVDKDGLNEKKTLKYGQNGILEKVELWHRVTLDKNYELVSFIQITTSGATLDIKTIKEINDQLINFVVR